MKCLYIAQTDKHYLKFFYNSLINYNFLLISITIYIYIKAE